MRRFQAGPSQLSRETAWPRPGRGHGRRMEKSGRPLLGRAATLICTSHRQHVGRSADAAGTRARATSAKTDCEGNCGADAHVRWPVAALRPRLILNKLTGFRCQWSALRRAWSVLKTGETRGPMVNWWTADRQPSGEHAKYGSKNTDERR